jgi:phosphatidylglycerophosphate synthase
MKKFGTFLCDRFSGRNAKNFKVQGKIFTRANLLTFSGILAVGFYIFQFTAGFFTAWIPVTKIFITATDMFDGWLADKYNEHSVIGKVMDPWRDRMSAGAVLLNMWQLFGAGVPIWFFAIIAVESIILIEGLFLSILQARVAEVHWVGKLRMVVHEACAFIILVQVYWLEHFYAHVSLLLGLMTLSSLAALVSYNFFHREKLARLLYRF